MMADTSLASLPDVGTSTPLARARRISILPLDAADWDSPSRARQQLHMLELENVGLNEELAHTEHQKLQLQSQLDTLRAQLGASGADAASQDEAAHDAAEIKGARRLLCRLTAIIATHDPNSEKQQEEEDKYYTLDQSLVHDPDRSIVAPTTTHLTTPNGKTRLARRFDSDLLDDIETLRKAWEEHARQATFAAIEARIAHTHAQHQADTIAHLQHQLDTAHSRPDTDTAQLTQELAHEKTRSAHLEAELTGVEARLAQTVAEAELTSEAAARNAAAQIEALQAELTERRQRTDEVHSIVHELAAKKDRLHAIELHRTQVEALQRVLAQQARIVDLLERQSHGVDETHTRWIDYVRETSSALSALGAPAPQTQPATAEVPEATEATEVQEVVGVERGGVVDALRGQVDELEARVLRRNEQIGLLQRQLHAAQHDLARTRTNQVLAQETIDELEAEKTELLGELEQLQAQLSATPVVAETREADMQTDSAPDAELLRLGAALAAAEARVVELEAEGDELASVRAALRRAEDRCTSLTLQMSAAELALAEQREAASADADRLESLEPLESQLASLGAEYDAQRTAHQATQLELSTLHSRIEAQHGELAQTQGELTRVRAEGAAATQERDVALEAERVARDELARLTTRHAELEAVLAEREAAMHARNAEYWTLKEELAELQEEAERSAPELITPQALETLRTDLAASRQSAAELTERVAAQEDVLLRFKTDLAAARSTEEMLNQQYAAAQRRNKELEQSQTQQQDTETNKRLEEVEDEVRYLQTRIAELEDELGRKADEIEEADSKILDALKEAKKYATRYTKLSARYEHAQKEAVDAQHQAAQLKLELEALHTLAKPESNTQSQKPRQVDKVSHEGQADETPASAVEGIGRKRKNEGEADAAVRTREKEVRAVYAPSPSRPAASFTPVRRTAKPVLGLGTCSSQNEGAMVRSTSNPSELVAARLSPVKPALADRTNLAAAASMRPSRLASKTPTTLLPALPAAGLEAEKRSVAPTAAAGAADFLARIKARTRT